MAKLPSKENKDGQAEGRESTESDESGTSSGADSESSRNVDGSASNDSGSVVASEESVGHIGENPSDERSSGSAAESLIEKGTELLGDVEVNVAKVEALTPEAEEEADEDGGFFDKIVDVVEDIVEEVVEAIVEGAVSKVLPDDLIKSRGRTRRF